MSIRKQLARVKRKLLKKPFLKDKRYPPYWLDQAFGHRKISLVQIGSNDGKTGDPLHQLLLKNPAWTALFVEPVPYLFERLKKNYTDAQRFQFANVAINEGKSLNFHWVDAKAIETFPDLPFWYDQLGSFDRGHIAQELGERIEPFILSEELPGSTLSDLLEQYDISSIDVLHIDTEGYDWKILSQLNLDRFTPGFILFESNHLSDEERKAAFEFLNTDYILFQLGIDLLAVHKITLGSQIPGMKQHMTLATHP